MARESQSSRLELSTCNRIAQVFLTHTDERAFPEVLGIIQEALQSPYGLFAYLNEHGELRMAAMTSEIWGQCRVIDRQRALTRDKLASLCWARALREKRTICANDPPPTRKNTHIHTHT